jgi:hypothetical protein
MSVKFMLLVLFVPFLGDPERLFSRREMIAWSTLIWVLILNAVFQVSVAVLRVWGWT